MKKALLLPILLWFILVSTSSLAQITLEATYNLGLLNQVYLKSNGWKYLDLNYADGEIKLYNLNHSIYKDIIVPIWVAGSSSIYFISESLFDTDSTDIEYVLSYGTGSGSGSTYHLIIFEESGNQLFTVDSLHFGASDGILISGYGCYPILATDSGTFMQLNTIGFPLPPKTKIYRLPGVPDLPPCCSSGSFLGGSDQYLSGYNSGYGMYSAPNPAKNYTKVYYDFPDGVTKGQLVFFNTLGNEVKRFSVDDLFNYIQVSTDDLPSGTYSYKIITSQGASEGKQLVVVH